MKKNMKRVISTIVALCILLASATCLMGMTASADDVIPADTTVFIWKDAPANASGVSKQYTRFGGCGFTQWNKGIADVLWGQDEGETVRVTLDYYNPDNGKYQIRKQPNAGGWDWGYSKLDFGTGLGSMDVSWKTTETNANTSVEPQLLSLADNTGKTLYIWNIHIWAHYYKDGTWYDVEFSGDDITHLYPANATSESEVFPETTYGELDLPDPDDISSIKAFKLEGIESKGEYSRIYMGGFHDGMFKTLGQKAGESVSLSFDYYNPNSGIWNATCSNGAVVTGNNAQREEVWLSAGFGHYSTGWTATDLAAGTDGSNSILPKFEGNGNNLGKDAYVWNIELTITTSERSYTYKTNDISYLYFKKNTSKKSYPVSLNEIPLVNEWNPDETAASSEISFNTVYYKPDTWAASNPWAPTPTTLSDAATQKKGNPTVGKTVNVSFDYVIDGFKAGDYKVSSAADSATFDKAISLDAKKGTVNETLTVATAGTLNPVIKYTGSDANSKLYIWNLKLSYDGKTFGISPTGGTITAKTLAEIDSLVNAEEPFVDEEPIDVPNIDAGSKVFAVPGWEKTNTDKDYTIRFGGKTAFGQTASSRGLVDLCYKSSPKTTKIGEKARIKFNYYNPDGAVYCVSNTSRTNTTHETQADVWIGKGYGSMDISYEVKNEVSAISFAPHLEFNFNNTGKTTYFWDIEIWVTIYDADADEFVDYYFTSEDGDIEYLYKGSNGYGVTTNCWYPTPYEETPFVNTWAPTTSNEELVFYGSKWNGAYASKTDTFKNTVTSTSANDKVSVSFDYYIKNPASDGKFVLTTESGNAAFDHNVALSAGKGSVTETFTITDSGKALQPVIKYVGDKASEINIWNVKISYNGVAYPVSFNGLTTSSFNDTTVYEQLDYMTEISFADDLAGETSAWMKPVTLIDGKEYTVSFEYFLSGAIDNLYVDGIENAKLVAGKNSYSQKIIGDGSDFTFKVVGDSDAYPAKLYVSSVTVTSDVDTRNFGAKAAWGVTDADSVSTETLFYDEEWFTFNYMDDSLESKMGDANNDGEVDVLDLVYANNEDSTYKDMRAVDYDKSFTVDAGDSFGIRKAVLGITEKRVIILTDAHLSALDEAARYGYTAEERVDILVESLKQYDRRNPFDEIIYLGDLSLDFLRSGDGDYEANRVNYSKKFVDLLRSEFRGKRTYFIPGNHDVYDNETWKGFVGQDRQFSFESGGYLFIACDNFYDAQGRDWVYNNTDVTFIEKTMEAYPDLPVVILGHGFKMAEESAEFIELLKNDRIVGLFQGHDHKAFVEDLSSYGIDKAIYYAGQFFYTETKPLGTQMWGFCDVILSDKGISVKYIEPSVIYEINNSRINYPYTESLECFMPVK